MRSTDVDALLAEAVTGVRKQPDQGTRFGILLSWDPSTGNNTVQVGATVLEDLPVLATGSVAMAPGDVVAILRHLNTYFILGTIRNAGTGSLQTRSVKIATAGQRTSTTFGDLSDFGQGDPGVGPTVQAFIGSSRQALVMLSATSSASADEYALMSVEVSGASTIPIDDININFLGADTATIQGSPTAVIQFTAEDGLNPGLNTFTAKYASFSGGNAAWRNRLLVVIPY